LNEAIKNRSLTGNSETIVHLISSNQTFDETDPSNVVIIMLSGRLKIVENIEESLKRENVITQ